MSSATSSRPRRATRRTVVESDDEDLNMSKMQESEDDFDPAPKSPARRQTRSRRSVAPAATTAAPKARGRPKRNALPPPKPDLAPENVAPEPADEEITVVEADPVKKASPRKRKSVAKPLVKPEEPEVSVMPTPKPSPSPEPSVLHEPLADITAAMVNERPRSSDDTTVTIKAVKPLETTTVLQKPMDIVLKSRSMALPVVEETGPRPRIVITYLILTNFKSYAGRQEVGPFHASFSSVVGPNGSGKSNVIDSLLFVFGFRASKMRQGKISALIHNSAQHPDLEYCEVAVHFQEVMDRVSFPGRVCWGVGFGH
jgi:structural maintenance of chromosome 4